MKVGAMLAKKLLPYMLALLTASAVFAGPAGSKVTGIYSDMYYNREAVSRFVCADQSKEPDRIIP